MSSIDGSSPEIRRECRNVVLDLALTSSKCYKSSSNMIDFSQLVLSYCIAIKLNLLIVNDSYAK